MLSLRTVSNSIRNNVLKGIRFASYQPITESKTNYPFSKQAILPQVLPSSIPPKEAPLNMLGRLNHQLKYSSESAQFYPLFARRGPVKGRIPPSSVLTVTYFTNGQKTHLATFAGVLIGVRRRGADISIRLRNVIMKTGVEQTFNLGSGLIKDIKVLKRGKMHRSKLYWVRKQPKALAKMASGIQSNKQ